ncbi:hypothetical protein CSQ32_004972 [Salmonella enterica subsp. diarizonae]|uniref:HTH lysR-type domain-containing protein n=1 Tax=Salmonella enterica subsp. diarizonae serovar 48:i:z TaxID=1192842 RepID=A0A735RKS2_SALDZ|nr:hypothetical protein [Salmonella enterica subsp. diarizonae serovar 48:i:z]EDP9134946.1 hypothetical protein [Salmonella enterica subsp. diarizonae]EDS4575527.1 hypothetical protein [Salmonella enterica]EDQ0639774.1 hypothetical protein [Salmonella enterica subsp. diarizonae]EDQ7017665.1 hypothetical protein [Salmonella enterica subsp. diarizonae]
MNFRRLKYFVKIVDTGSLMPAAEVLHIEAIVYCFRLPPQCFASAFISLPNLLVPFPP